MAHAERKAKDQAMSADLARRGYPHGRRFTTGLSNIPDVGESGSAAYRRRKTR